MNGIVSGATSSDAHLDGQSDSAIYGGPLHESEMRKMLQMSNQVREQKHSCGFTR